MKKTTFLIIGRHAVTEALKNPTRKFIDYLLLKMLLKRLNKEHQKINF